MARNLRYLGLGLLALTACLLLSDAMGWTPAGQLDPAIGIGWRAGLICLAAGVALTVLAPLGRVARKGRCVRCGAGVERGQVYCRDHLKATVDEYRDQLHDRG